MTDRDTSHPFSPDVVENPFPYYAALRERGPVHWIERPGYYVVVSHEVAVEVASDPARFGSNLVALIYLDDEGAPAVFELPAGAPRAVDDVLGTADPPDHGRQRRVMATRMSLRSIAALEGAIRAKAEALLDRFPASGNVELMDAYARPLPLAVIREWIGLPAEDEAQLLRWSEIGVAQLSGVLPLAEVPAAARELLAFRDYLRGKFDRTRKSSGDDLLGDLARAVADATLSEGEAVSMLMQTVIGGAESTTSLLGAAVEILATDPALQARVRADRTLVPKLLEEAMRLEPPFLAHFRSAKEATTLAGVPIPQGKRVMIHWAAANRDPAVFPNPDAVDLDRPNLSQQLAFGWGPHRCVGAPLARLEARVAIDALLDRSAAIRLAPGAPRAHVASLFIRSLESLALEALRYGAAGKSPTHTVSRASG